MAGNITDRLSAQKPQFDEVLQKIYNDSAEIATKVVKGDFKINVGRFYATCNLELYYGLTMSKTTLNAAQGLPVGRGFTTLPYYAGVLAAAYAHTLTTEDMTDGTTSALISGAKSLNARTISGTAMGAKILEDITLHGDGSGTLTAGASAIATTSINYQGQARTVTVYTFADATDARKADRLVQGMAVECFASDLTTRRAVANMGADAANPLAPITIHGINYDTGAVTLTENITSAAVGDVLAFPGLIAPSVGTNTFYPSGYSGGATPPLSAFNQASPAGGAPTWWSNATPDPFAGTYFSQNGITGDAWRHGLDYALDTTPGRYFYQIQKSQVPELIPANYNAGGAPLNYFMPMIVMEQLQQRRSEEVFEGLIGLAHQVQFRAWHDAGLAVTSHFVDGPAYGKTFDQSPDGRSMATTFNVNGVTVYKDKRWARDQMAFINPANIGKAIQQNLTKYDQDGGDGIHYRVSLVTGTPTSVFDLHLFDSWDYVYRDPGAAGIITNLARPIGG